MIGMTSLRRTTMPSMNAGAVGTEVEPLYWMIWRTAMMSRTNVSGPTRKVMRRRSLMAVSCPHPELPRLVIEAANRVVEQPDGLAHVAGQRAIPVRDRTHLLHGRDDLL